MVAIVTGKGPGLETGSGSVLGGQGMLGSGATGRSGESVVLNAATGNLVISAVDEMLVGRGPDAAIARTYNSLGAWDGDNDDYWRAGVYRRVFGLTGGSGYGTSGSMVKRTDWDGSEITYTWNADYYSTGVGAYVATAGSGAYDTLTKSGSVWTWTDGDTGVTETYDENNAGRITARSDRDANTITYTYTGSLITRVSIDADNYTNLVYGGTGGLQLQSLVTYSTQPTAQVTRVYYTYDAYDRLSVVKVNLAPADNSSSTGTNYETTYTYTDTVNNRVASIAQSDGTLVAFAYTLVGSDYRVTGITQTVASGVARTTAIAYDTTNRVTTITDNAGQSTRLTYDADNNLIKIVTPPTGAAMTPLATEFVYEADGDVSTARLGPGNTIVYTYDSHGNRTYERDSAGNVVERTYSAKNELLTAKRYLTPDPDGAGSGTPSSPLTTTYIYDSLSHLRYVVTSAGRVTEYRYDGFGQRVSAIDYASSTYSSTLTESALNAWVGAMTDRSGAQRTDTWYDLRGNVARTATYATLDVRGDGAQSPLTVTADSDTNVIQRTDGLYRITRTGGTDNNWAADARSLIKAEGDFVLQMRPGQTNKYTAAGVAVTPGASSSDPNLDFGITFNSNGFAYAKEGATSTSLGTSYTTTSSFWLVRTGNSYSYYQGATLSAAMGAGALRTVTGTTATVYFSGSVYSIGSTIDVAFTPQPIVNGANTTVAQQADGMYRVTRTGGGGNAWNADARGSMAATGDFALKLRALQTNKYIAAGVSTSPGADSGLTLNYGFYLYSNGNLAYSEAGGAVSLGTTYAANETLWLVRVGSTLTYRKGATLEAAMAATALRTVTGVTSTLYFDSSFYDLNGAIDVAFAPGTLSAPEISRTDYIYDPSGRLISRAIAGQGVETFVYDGLGRVTSSTDMAGVTTGVTFTDATTSTTAVTLASGLTQLSTYNRAGELVSYQEKDGSTVLATTSYGYDSLGRLRSVTDPTGQTRYVLYDAVGRKIADIDGDGSLTEYRYDANHNLTSSTSYATKLTGAQLAALGGATVTAIANGVNTSVVQQSNGLYRATKTAGTNTYDADARGSVGAAGDFVLRIRPGQANADLVAGVSTSPASSSGSSNVAYGFSFSDSGTLLYNEGSSYASLGVSFTAGQDFWLVRTGTTINYYRGDTLEQALAAGSLRTATGASGTFYFDSALRVVGSSVDAGFVTPSLELVRPAADATNDRWAWNVYDRAQRLIETIDGTGAVTLYSYDGASQLISTTQRANLVSGTTLTAMKAAAISPNLWANPNDGSLWWQSNLTRTSAAAIDGANAYTMTVTASSNWGTLGQANTVAVAAGDTMTLDFWLKAGTTSTVIFALQGSSSGFGGGADSAAVSLSGPGTVTLNGSGYWQITGLDTSTPTHITVTRTFASAENVQSYINIGYTAGLSAVVGKPSLVKSPTAPINLPTADGTNDRVSRMLYDGDGLLVGTLDAQGYLTEIVYDGAGRKIRTIAYSDDVSSTTGDLATLRAALTQDSAKDIRNQWLYDARGLLRATVDGEGTVTRFDYSPAGYLTQQVRGQIVTPTTTYTLATLPSAGGAILETTVWTHNLYGQVLTETRTLTDSTTTTTAYTYDNMRRLISTVTQSGGSDARTYNQRYDKQGRLIGELSGDGSAVLASYGGSPTSTQINNTYRDYGWTYAYDAADRLISKTGPQGSGSAGAKTLYYYNTDDSLAYEVSALGEVAEYRYNAFGERTDLIVYGTRVSTSGMTGGLTLSQVTSVLTANSAIDSTIATAFNVDGTVKQVTDPLSNTTTYAYNAFGELITQVAPFDTSTTIQTSFTYDRRGLLKTQVVDSAGGGKALTTTYGYDAFGRAVTLTNALNKVTTSTYDRKSRLTKVKDALNNETLYAYDGRDNLVTVTDALGNKTRFVYDKANRKIATIDALGALTTTTYDADGRVIAERAYKNLVSLSGLATEVAENNSTFTTAVAATHAEDRVTRYAYDKDGQLRFTVDGLGHAVEYVNDVNGNVIRTVQYDGTISPAGYSESQIASAVSSLAGAAGTRTTRAVYDAANRLNYSIDAIGQVTWHVYDAKGQLIKQVEFAATYGTAGDQLVGTLDTWRSSNANAANDRTTRAFYDRKGQLAYSVDALGYVTRFEYDKLGNVRKQTAYAAIDPDLTIGDSTTLAQMTSEYGAGAGNDRVTQFSYDSAGRLETTTDPEGFVTKLVLDAMGQVTSSTVAFGVSGQASTTAFVYDDVGRVVKQTRAFGETEATNLWFFYDALGQHTATVDGDNYLVVRTYDAVGQVTASTAYAGKITGAFTTASTVATLQTLAGTSTYDIATSATYDSFGRVKTATDGRGSVVTNNYDVIDQLTSQTQELESGTTDDRTTAYTYDNFGNVVKTVDPHGNAGFAYYDKLGRVTRQVDAERYVTDTDYTRGSQVKTVKRYWTAATGTITETSPPSTPSGTVATTTFGYNKRDQVTSVQDAESFTESYTLNAFGERATVTSKLGHATTYTFDKRGLVLTETLPVTTKNSSNATISVVNKYTYDGRGNRLTMVEAFGAVEARTTTYTYDKLDRVLTSSGDAVTIVNEDLTSTSGVTPVETYKYDKRGNLIETIVEMGATDIRTLAWYDAFGRKIAEASPVGSVTHWAYDKADNVTSLKRFETAITLPGDATGSVPGSGNFRETSYAYDRSNRLTTTTIASLLTGQYASGSYSLTTGSVVTTVEYDKNGNAIRQEDGRGNSIYIYYDKLGRAIAKVDAEKYLTVWARDAEGNVTTETRYADQIGSGESVTTSTALATLIGYADDDPTNDRITEFTYDKNGRRTEEKRLKVAYTSISASGVATNVAATDSSAVSKINYTYNGLGQVLTKTEANLADISVSSTAREAVSYTYDQIGRLTLEEGQAFKDYLWTSGGYNATPRTAYTYDGLNNLKSTRVQIDASGTSSNDRVTSYTYGAGGRLASMTDAANNIRYFGYDLAGRTVLESYDRLKADGTTTITEGQVTRYDLAGRVITQTNARKVSGTWTFVEKTVSSTDYYYDAVRIRYNAFGEVTGRGLTGGTTGPGGTAVYQETLDYDAGGRLWKSNGGDGVLRFYVYDKSGNQTLTLASTGADLSGLTVSNYTASITSTGDTSTSNAVTSLTVYDKRGQATQTRDPDRLLATGSSTVTIVHAKTYNAFGEVATETGAGGFDSSGAAITSTNSHGHTGFEIFTTTYSYNTMGRLTSKAQMMVDITGVNGAISYDYRPTENYGYDLAGRLVSVTDANSNVTTRLLLAGTGHGSTEALVTKEFHPDGGVFENKYDVFGDLRTTINEIGNTSTREYDKMGRLTVLTHPTRAAGTPGNTSGSASTLVDNYIYDQLGQRTGHWNSQFTNAYVERTDYDAKGRVVSEIDYMGTATTYKYTWSTSVAASGLTTGVTGGWVKETINKAGLTMTEGLDYYGRRTDLTDFGGHDYGMTFDLGGRLYTQTNAGGESITYSWYNTGNLAQQVMNGTTGTYEYDAEGRRTKETFGSLQNATVTYDALGRMKTWSDTGVGGTIPANTSYEYDANGNVRRTKAVYRTPGTSTDVPLDYWYLYDSMNRYTVAMGVLAGTSGGSPVEGDAARGVGTISRGLFGWDVAWNAASQRVHNTRTITVTIPQYGSGPYGPVYLGSTTYYWDARWYYGYAADGQLEQVFFATGNQSNPNAPATSSGMTATQTNVRDSLGRVTASQNVTTTYNMRSEVLTQTQGSSTTYYDYNLESYAGSGVYTGAYQGGVTTHTKTVTASQPDQHTDTTYVWWQGAQQDLLTYKPNTTTTNTTDYSYDVSGRLTSAVIVDYSSRTILYDTDAQGKIVRRYNSYPQDWYYRFNGREIGYTSSVVVQQAMNGSYQRYADFDQGFDLIEGTNADRNTTYVVQTGDTLRLIAQSLWGDSSLWYKLAQANGLNGDETLAAGRVLVIPQNVGSIHHNATTFQPYDPNKAIGDTFPGSVEPPVQPAPPKGKKGCGIVGQLLVALVSVAIAVALPHIAPGIFGGFWGGVGAAVVGNVVGQGVGIATGVQDKFSFKSVAMTALTAGVGAGLDKIGLAVDVGSKVANAAINGMITSAVTQGIAVATGLQKKFDFVGVAIAGVVAGVGQAVSDALPGRQGEVIKGSDGKPKLGVDGKPLTRAAPTSTNNAISGMAGAIAGAATRSLVTGTSFGDNILAVLPDVIGSTIGRALGNAIGEGVERRYVRRLSDRLGEMDEFKDLTPERRTEIAQGFASADRANGQSFGSVERRVRQGDGWNDVADINQMQVEPGKFTLEDYIRLAPQKMRFYDNVPESKLQDVRRFFANVRPPVPSGGGRVPGVPYGDQTPGPGGVGPVFQEGSASFLVNGDPNDPTIWAFNSKLVTDLALWGGAAIRDINSALDAIPGLEYIVKGIAFILAPIPTLVGMAVDHIAGPMINQFVEAAIEPVSNEFTSRDFSEEQTQLGTLGIVAGLGLAASLLKGRLSNFISDLKELGGKVVTRVRTSIAKFFERRKPYGESFLSREKIDEIRGLGRGNRPDPATYMNKADMDSILGGFDEGASRFAPADGFDRWGPAQTDGTSFVMPKSEADALWESTGGDPAKLAQALGLPPDQLARGGIVRIDIDNPRELGLRIPSGNEAGANDQWIPGGRLPNGNSEAVIDLGGQPPSRYRTKRIK